MDKLWIVEMTEFRIIFNRQFEGMKEGMGVEEEWCEYEWMLLGGCEWSRSKHIDAKESKQS